LGRISLEQMDAVRERTGASYAECWEALRATGGDAAAAVALLEEGDQDAATEGAAVPAGLGGAVAARLAQLVREGLRTRLLVRRGARTVVELPAVVGLAGAALFPRAVAAGIVAALAARCALVLERGRAGL
jgi:shikimate 5-dehydrogenase